MEKIIYLCCKQLSYQLKKPIMKTIKTILAVRSIKGAKFVGIKGYENTQGEVSNQTVIVNVTYENILKKDLNKLKEFNLNSLENKFNIEDIKKGYDELISSLEKRLSDEKTKEELLANGDKTMIASQGQKDAYDNLGNGLRINKETKELYLYGLVVHKTIEKAIEYKEVKSRLNTIIKNTIKKTCKLRNEKFRNFLVGNMDELNVNGLNIK
jgi:hypothetical protein